MPGEIRVGTLVLIIKSSYPEMVGRSAEVVEIDPAPDREGYRYHIRTDPTDASPSGLWRAARDQILPITPPDQHDETNTDTPVEQRELLPA